MQCWCIFFTFNIHRAGRTKPPGGPVLGHGPCVWHSWYKQIQQCVLLDPLQRRHLRNHPEETLDGCILQRTARQTDGTEKRTRVSTCEALLEILQDQIQLIFKTQRHSLQLQFRPAGGQLPAECGYIRGAEAAVGYPATTTISFDVMGLTRGAVNQSHKWL